MLAILTAVHNDSIDILNIMRLLNLHNSLM